MPSFLREDTVSESRARGGSAFDAQFSTLGWPLPPGRPPLGAQTLPGKALNFKFLDVLRFFSRFCAEEVPMSKPLVLALAFLSLLPAALHANTPSPQSVTVAGDLQSELGCTADWMPDCANTHLTYDASDDVWQGTFNVPAGAYQYKAALNDGWTENYGANA